MGGFAYKKNKGLKLRGEKIMSEIEKLEIEIDCAMCGRAYITSNVYPSPQLCPECLSENNSKRGTPNYRLPPTFVPYKPVPKWKKGEPLIDMDG